jgi:hypothetical protein
MDPYFTEMLAAEHRAALLAVAEAFRLRPKATGRVRPR